MLDLSQGTIVLNIFSIACLIASSFLYFKKENLLNDEYLRNVTNINSSLNILSKHQDAIITSEDKLCRIISQLYESSKVNINAANNNHKMFDAKLREISEICHRVESDRKTTNIEFAQPLAVQIIETKSVSRRSKSKVVPINQGDH